MSVLVVGLSHRSAPVSVLERATLAPETQAKLLADALAAAPVAEAAVLATCNRIEVYAAVEKFHAGVAELSTLLAQHAGVGLEELTPHLYVHYEDRAVHHLFSVGCGLDSMVVGEAQILGQLKESLALGQELHSAGRLLNDLFQQALRVGKRAHTETGIDKAGQSLVSFGLEQLAGESAVTDWAGGKRALVIGAGSMSALAAATLARVGVAELVIANRTYERAERLAANLDAAARAVRIDAVPYELAAADVVISCTGATGLVLTADDVREAAAGRTAQQPLALLDLAMPRDIDHTLHGADGVRLVDIETLAEAAANDTANDTSDSPSASAGPLAADVDQARAIVVEEVTAFGAAQRAASITPTVVALRTMAQDLVAAEVARLEGRLPGLDERQRAEITQTVRRVVDKLLHAPTVRVKELAGTPGGAGYADALRELFDLDPATVDAVSRADHADSSASSAGSASASGSSEREPS